MRVKGQNKIFASILLSGLVWSNSLLTLERILIYFSKRFHHYRKMSRVHYLNKCVIGERSQTKVNCFSHVWSVILDFSPHKCSQANVQSPWFRHVSQIVCLVHICYFKTFSTNVHHNEMMFREHDLNIF